MKQKGLYRHWKKIYSNQQHDFRNTSLINLISKELNPNIKVLDVGCGTCGLTLELMCRGFDVVGLDNSEEMLLLGKKLLLKNGFKADNLVHSSLKRFAALNKGRYEQIVCLDVIEHIENDKDAVDCLINLMKKDGILVLSVPSLPWLYGPKDKAVGHYRRYSLKQLKSLFNENKIELLGSRFWNLIGVPITLISVKIFRKRVSEEFRYKISFTNYLLQKILKVWFQVIENNVKPPIGLTAIIKVKKINQ